jgi:hypothetical protein
MKGRNFMKKFMSLLIVALLISSFSLTVLANESTPVDNSYVPGYSLLHSRPYKASKITPINGGQCVHFAEEIFYQEYGIWFNLQDNATTTIKALGDRYIKGDDGKRYKLEWTTTPTENSIVFFDIPDRRKAGIKDKWTHVAWVEKITKIGKTTFVDILESSTTNKSSYDKKYYYYDIWYATNYFTTQDYPEVKYLIPIIEG